MGTPVRWIQNHDLSDQSWTDSAWRESDTEIAESDGLVVGVKYLFLARVRYHNQSTTNLVRARISRKESGQANVVKAYTAVEPADASSNRKKSSVLGCIETMVSGYSYVVEMQGSGSTTKDFSQIRLIAIPLDDISTYVENHSTSTDYVTNIASSWTDSLSQSFTPVAEGDDYLVIMGCAMDFDNTTQNSHTRSNIDGGVYSDQIYCSQDREGEDSSEAETYFSAAIFEGLAAATSYTVKMQHRTEGAGTLDIERPYICIIRLTDQFSEYHNVEDDTAESSSVASGVTFEHSASTDITHTIAGDYLLLGVCGAGRSTDLGHTQHKTIIAGFDPTVGLTSNWDTDDDIGYHAAAITNVNAGSKEYTANNVHFSSGNKTLKLQGVSLVSLLLDTEPNPPTGLVASNPTANSIDLTWVAPVLDGGQAVDGYKIEKKADGGSWETAVADTGNTNVTATVTGLDPSTTYTFRVYALNPIGESDSPSNEDSETTLAESGATLNGLLPLPIARKRFDFAKRLLYRR